MRQKLATVSLDSVTELKTEVNQGDALQLVLTVQDDGSDVTDFSGFTNARLLIAGREIVEAAIDAPPVLTFTVPYTHSSQHGQFVFTVYLVDTNGNHTLVDGEWHVEEGPWIGTVQGPASGATINDGVTSTSTAWSSSKINTELGTKAATGHGHAIGDVTDLQTELDGKAASVAAPGSDDQIRVYQSDGSVGYEAKPAGGAANIEALGDVDAGTVAADQILHSNTAGDAVKSSPGLKFDGTNTLKFLNDWLRSVGGSMELLNNSGGDYRNLKLASIVPNTDNRGVYRGSNDHFYPNVTGPHLHGATHGHEFRMAGNLIGAIKTTLGLMPCPATAPVTWNMPAGTIAWAVDETAHELQFYVKYSDGTTWKKLGTAISLTDA